MRKLGLRAPPSEPLPGAAVDQSGSVFLVRRRAGGAGRGAGYSVSSLFSVFLRRRRLSFSIVGNFRLFALWLALLVILILIRLAFA